MEGLLPKLQLQLPIETRNPAQLLTADHSYPTKVNRQLWFTSRCFFPTKQYQRTLISSAQRDIISSWQLLARKIPIFYGRSYAIRRKAVSSCYRLILFKIDMRTTDKSLGRMCIHIVQRNFPALKAERTWFSYSCSMWTSKKSWCWLLRQPTLLIRWKRNILTIVASDYVKFSKPAKDNCDIQLSRAEWKDKAFG